MNSLKPILEDIARARGEVALSLYFDPRLCSPADLEKEQVRLEAQMKDFQHPNLVGKHVTGTETVLRLNSPDRVDEVLRQIAPNYKGMVYDVYLTDDKGKAVGRAWAMYDFIGRIDAFEGISTFYEEIAGTEIVPESIRRKVAESVKAEGSSRLRESGLGKHVAEWEACF